MARGTGTRSSWFAGPRTLPTTRPLSYATASTVPSMDERAVSPSVLSDSRGVMSSLVMCRACTGSSHTVCHMPELPV